MATLIDSYGAHLFGCTCHDCTKTNVQCPECGRKYWTEWDHASFECPRCMHNWNEGNEMAYQSHLASMASFDRSLKQIHDDTVRLGIR